MIIKIGPYKNMIKTNFIVAALSERGIEAKLHSGTNLYGVQKSYSVFVESETLDKKSLLKIVDEILEQQGATQDDD